MKPGKTLLELAQELTRINETKKDYLIPVPKMSMNNHGWLEFTNGELNSLPLNSHSHGQLSAFTDIPKGYYDRLLLESPALLAKNVNHGFAALSTANKTPIRLVRCLDNNIRAFLSNSYRIIDGYEVINELLPILLESGLKLVSSEITEKRIYLKMVTDKIQGEVTKGDIVQYGLTISTSDVGAGSLRIEPLMYRLVCLNGMIMSAAQKQYHIGRKQNEREVFEILSDSTKELDNKAFMAKTKDILAYTMRPEYFSQEIEKMKNAANDKITNFANLDQVVELTMDKVGVKNSTVKNSILEALVNGNEGAGLTRWGMANSFTRAAQSPEVDYELATDLERAGGKIIELSAQDWKHLIA